MKEVPFKLLCLILFAVSIVACSSAPEKTVTLTASTATLAMPTKTPTLPMPPSTATPTLTATPAYTACPPFAIDTALPVLDEPQNYIGLHFDTLPAGLTSPGGSVLDGSDTYYMLSQVIRDSGEMLWLERNICHDERGYPYQEIRAVLFLPALQANERLIMGTCRLKETATSEVTNPPMPDPAIVAVGRFEDVYKPPVALTSAWRANPPTESFETLPPESVTCTGIEGL
jgi:hypothetical protein